ncbi:MAG TPA: gamma carbonic anhydrase family protein, partial [Spirochaetales bacterium]|nr:gamma carbonic anhydrase family protein [Spirochaetales bacterium]
GTVIHVDEGVPCRIGNHVTVGHRALLHGCTVEDGCLIGMGAIVLDKAVIGAGSVVGAGALVTQGKQFPPHSLIIGSPARVVRTLTDEDVQAIQKGALHYIENAQKAMHWRRIDEQH